MDMGARWAMITGLISMITEIPEIMRFAPENATPSSRHSATWANREVAHTAVDFTAVMLFPIGSVMVVLRDVAARRLGLRASEVGGLYLHAFAANLVQVAVRFVPLGQTKGQAVLAGLQPMILAVAADAACCDLCDIGSAALGSDLAAMTHETLEVRIFRT